MQALPYEAEPRRAGAGPAPGGGAKEGRWRPCLSGQPGKFRAVQC